jgi:hypothetical protein
MKLKKFLKIYLNFYCKIVIYSIKYELKLLRRIFRKFNNCVEFLNKTFIAWNYIHLVEKHQEMQFKMTNCE